MVLNRPLLVRLARIISTALVLKPIRSVYDDTGIHCHFYPSVKRPKVNYAFEGPYSKVLKKTVSAAFSGVLAKIESIEARIDTDSLFPFLHGSLALTTGEVILWEVSPITTTLTVRQIDPTKVSR
jgi:hypothetical protein